MDTNALHNCFQATLDANINVRRQAELQLKQAEKSPGFINGCLDIALEPQVSAAVQTAAVVYLKNKVSRYWIAPEGTNVQLKIDEDEKPVFRERLIPALVKSSPQIRVILVSVLNSIVSRDFPQSWPSFLDITLELFQTNDIGSVRTGLSCLLEICRYYKWMSGDSRKGLDHVIDTAFAGVLAIGNSLVNETSTPAAEMLRDILKIYKCTINLELPDGLQEQSSLIGWGNLHLLVVRKELPLEVVNLDVDEREMHPWTKCKKWAFYNLYRLFSRYGSTSRLPTKKSAKYPGFSKMFTSIFVPEILNAYFGQIELWVADKIWIGQAPMYHLLGFLEECVNNKSCWDLVKPHVEIIISHVIFPLLCPTDSDLDLFEDEPEEYIHKRIDIFEESPTPDIAATNFLLTLVRKKKKTVFNNLLKFIQGVLDEHLKNQEDLVSARRKEGALRMMGTIAYIVLGKNSPIVKNMEPFLVRYVFPDFQSKFGFLRARACEFINRYAEVEFNEVQNISFVYQSVLKCLDDRYLPVQVEAALALQPMIAHEEVRDALSSRIPEVMQKLLELANRVDIDALSGVMEEFVEVFSQQLTPFSVQLAEQLRDQLMRILGEIAEKQNIDIDSVNFNDLAGEEKTMAALGLLNTLSTLLLALDNARDIVEKLELVLLPIIHIVFEQQLSEFYSEIFSLIENCTFCLKSVSPTMWNVFVQLNVIIKDEALDYLDEAYPCLDNYIQYGTLDLINNPGYIAALFEIYHTVMIDTERLGSNERAIACQLAQKLLINLKGHVDQYVAPILELAVQRLSTDPNIKNIVYLVSLIEVILSGLYYNASATLGFLESQGFIQQFFVLWFQNMEKLSRVYDKKLAVIAILSIVVLPEDQVSPSIYSNFPQLSEALITIQGSLPAAIALREDLAKKYSSYGDDYDTAYDSDEGDEIEEWNDEEEEEADSGAAQEYMSYLESESAKLSNKGFGLDVDDEELEEEPLIETSLDSVNTFIGFRDAFYDLQQSNVTRYQLLVSGLSEDKVKIMEQTISRANEDERKLTAVAVGQPQS